MSLLEVSNLSFGYEKPEIFSDISFQVKRGEIFCILGPNGCGKTTLLDCVLGILKPRRGAIRLDGKNISDLKPAAVARHIAYVPQNHEKTFPYTVLEVVLMGRTAYTGLFAAPTSEDVEIAELALELVGISRLKDRPYTRLSGGEGQLVMIARALAQKTPVIVMDEPSVHLDFKHELVILETIVQLVRNAGLSVIMATHVPNHAFYFENNRLPVVVAMMNGRNFSAVGSPTEVLTEGGLKSLYNINARVVCYHLDNDSELRQVIPISTISSTDMKEK